jgi:aerobic-type carbon monoxide dehydrogenase small subunit (CoxS/CutS family)
VTAQRVHLRVNGADHEVVAPTDRFLVDVLRDDLRLVGTKVGCEIGVCGLCAVIVDGTVQSACLLPVVALDGSAIETIEGLAGPDGELSAVQAAFVRHGAIQCGICTPGQIVTATALLRERPKPGRDEIRDWLMGSLCRCTGYEPVVDAIMSVAGSSGGAVDGPRSA